MKPQIISDGQGGAIIVWRDYRNVTNNYDIYTQRIDAEGNTLWDANGTAICTAPNNQDDPMLCTDGKGGAFITWRDLRAGGIDWNIYVQNINSTGHVQWLIDGIQIINNTLAQVNPKIVSDGQGGAYVTWDDNRDGNYDIYAQRVNAVGDTLWTTNGIGVVIDSSSQSGNQLISDGFNNSIVVWEDDRNGNSDVYAQKLDLAGNVIWTSNGVAVCDYLANQYYTQLAPDGAGGAIFVWNDYRDSNNDIYAQRIDSTGTEMWTANGEAICDVTDDQNTPKIAADGNGGAIISWNDRRSGIDYDIYAQRVAANGLTQWTSQGVVICNSSGIQDESVILNVDNGSTIIAWTDTRGGTDDIYAQYVNSTGITLWTANGSAVTTAQNAQNTPQITSSTTKGAIIVWRDFRKDTGDIYAQRVFDGDNEGPSMPIISSPTHPSEGTVYYWPDITLQWTASVDPSGVYNYLYTYDQNSSTVPTPGSNTTVLTTVSYTGIPDGTWYFHVRANDTLGNLGDAAHFQFVIDAWPADGIPVFTDFSEEQDHPQITTDGVGGAIISWHANTGDSYIWAQRIAASGQYMWDPNGTIICDIWPTRSKGPTALCSDGAGGAIVVWADYRSLNFDIYAQRINSTGQVQWTTNGIVICNAGNGQEWPEIASDGAGGAFIVWEDNRNSVSTGYDIYAQHINSSGIPQWTANGLLICNASGQQNRAELILSGTSGTIITWEDLRKGGEDVYAQRIVAGTPMWGLNGIPICTVANNQKLPLIVPDGADGGIIMWEDERADGGDIYAQRVDVSGVIQWAPNGTVICVQSGDQNQPRIASDENGGAIIVWADSRADWDIYAQKINSTGQVQWAANGIAICNFDDSQTGPGIASDGFGGAIIAWSDWRNMFDADMFAQHVNAAGEMLLTPNGTLICGAPASQSFPQCSSITEVAPYQAMMAWNDLRNGMQVDIYAQRVIGIDTDGPAAPTISSPTHPDQNSTYYSPDVHIEWTEPFDPSGIANYLYTWDMNPLTEPLQFDHITTILYADLTDVLDGTWYFHVRANDSLGNLGSTAHFQFTINSSLAPYYTWDANGTVINDLTQAQTNPQIISDGEGGAIIAWIDQRIGSPAIYAQRINATGQPLWTAYGAPVCTFISSKSSLMITTDGNGGAILVWIDFRSGSWFDVYTQRINATGQILWTPNGVNITLLNSHQYSPSIISDGSGGAIIAWEDNRDVLTNSDIYAQRINSTGQIQWTTNGIAVCKAALNQFKPRMASDGSGGAIVVWEDQRTGSSNTDIYAQRVLISGTMAWMANGIPISNEVDIQNQPQLTSDGLGGALITWQDARFGNTDIYAQRIDSSGAGLWFWNGTPICIASSSQLYPEISLVASDEVVIAWQDYRTGDNNIYAQRLKLDGQFLWPLNGLPICNEINGQINPVLTPDGVGGAYITWIDNRIDTMGDIYAQLVNMFGQSQYEPNGTIICNAIDQQFTVRIASGDNGAIITWADRRNGQYDIFSQRIRYVDTTGPLAPTISSTTHPNNISWYSSTTINLTWTLPLDVTGVYNYIYKYDSNPTTQPTSTDSSSLLNWTQLTDIPEGTWYFHVRGNDTLGNLGDTGHFMFKVDSSPPQASNPRPYNNSFTNDAQPNIYLDIADSLSSVGSVSLLVNGSIQSSNWNGTTLSWTGSGYPSGTLLNIEVSANDVAGNIMDWYRWRFIIDTDPPVVSEVLPEHYSYTSNPQPNITVYLDDVLVGLNTTSVVMRINGSIVNTIVSPYVKPILGALEDVSQEALGSHTPEIAVDSLGNIHVVWRNEASPYDIMYRCWNATTLSWGSAEEVSIESIDRATNPEIAVDADGNVHVAWEDDSDGWWGTLPTIFYKYRNATTGIWSGYINSTDVIAPGRESQSCDIAVDPTGQPHIVWYDQAWSAIYYRSWNASLHDWMAIEEVSSESTAVSLGAAIAIDSHGQPHVVWYDSTNIDESDSNAYDIFYKYRNATTGNWTTVEVISLGSTQSARYPDIAIDPADNVHVVWRDQRVEAGGQIFYRLRNATTESWTNMTVIGPFSGQSSYPRVAATDGFVHVVWQDSADYAGAGSTDYDIFYRVQDISKNIWSDIEVVSTESNETDTQTWYPALDVDNAGTAHIVWEDTKDILGSGGDWDVFYKNIKIDISWKATYTPPSPYPLSSALGVALDAADLLGNAMSTYSWEFTIDLDPPVASDPYPLIGSYIADDDPTISLKLTDGLSGINASSIILTVEGSIETHTWNGTHLIWDSSGPYPSETLLNIGVEAQDNVGNSMAPFAWWFTIDTEAPLIILDAPLNNTALPKPSTINLTVYDPAGLGMVRWRANITQTTWTSTFTGTYDIPLSSFATDQIVHFWVEANDSVGNLNQIEIILTFDNMAPMASNPYPQNNSYIANDDPIILLNLEDTLSGINVLTMNLLVNGLPKSISWNGTTLFWYSDGPYASGTLLNLTVTVQDNAGNAMTPYSWSFTIDITPPLAFNPFPINHTYISTSTPNINVSIADPLSGIDTIEMRVNGTLVTPTWTQWDFNWSLTEVLSAESTGYSQYPRIATDPFGNLHIVWQDRTNYMGSGGDYDIFYKCWNATTSQWMATVVVSTESDGSSYIPTIAVDNVGNIYVAWYDNMNYSGSGSDWDIFYKLWNATTGIWTVTQVISTESDGGSVNPDIAVDKDGNVHLTWQDLTNYSGCGTDYDIFYKCWNVSTSSWSLSEVLSTGTAEPSVTPSITVDLNDNIHIVWHQMNGISDNILYKCWNATTGTWTITEIISTESTLQATEPAIEADNKGNIHVTWLDNSPYAGSDIYNDVFYKYLNATTRTWTMTEIVSNESPITCYYPTIAIDPTGHVHIAWYEHLNDQEFIYYKYRNTTTSIWTNTELISTESRLLSYRPDIAVDSTGTIHIVWQDTYDYNGAGPEHDIFYKKKVPSSYFTLNWTATSPYLSGSYISVEINATDNLGNVMSIYRWGFNIDLDAPIASNPYPVNISIISSSTPTIGLDLTDLVSGVDNGEIELRVNGSLVSHSWNGTRLSWTPPGPYPNGATISVEVIAKDFVGNIMTPYSWFFTVDLEPPQASNPTPPDSSFISDVHPTILIDLDDSLSGVNASSIILIVESIPYTVASTELDYMGTTITFNPTSDYLDGQVVRISLDASDNLGNAMITYNWSFIVDVSAPLILNEVPQNGTCLNDIQPNITVLITDLISGVNSSSINLSVEGTDYSLADSELSYIGFTLIFTPSTPFAEAEEINLILTVSDNATNAITPYIWSFIIDVTGPQASNPNPTAAYVADNQPTITITLNDTLSGVNASSINLNVEGIGYDISSPELSYIGTTVIFNPSSPFTDAQQIDIALDASDNVGNVMSTFTWFFIIDLSGPLAGNETPTNGGYTGNFLPFIGVDLVDSMSGVNASTIVLTVASTVRPHNWDGTTVSWTSGTPFGDGQTIICQVEASDNIGNTMGPFIWVFTVDLSPPQASNPIPADGGYTNSSQPIVNITLTDSLSGVNANSIVLTVEGTDYNLMDSELSYNNSILTFIPSISFSDTDIINLTLNAYDNEGTLMTAFSWSFTVDLTPPTAFSEIPVNNTEEYMTDIPQINVTLSDWISGINASTIVLTLNGVPVVYSFNGINVSYTPAPLPQLVWNNVTVDVSDIAGNPMPQYRWRFLINLSRPTIRDVTPFNNSYVNSATPEISAFIDSPQLAINEGSINLTVNGVQVQANFNNVTGKVWNITSIPFTHGQLIQISLSANDSIDNTCFAYWSFIIDLNAPTVTGHAPLDTYVNNSMPTILINITDDISGISGSSIAMNVSGVPVSPAWDGLTVSWTPGISFSNGDLITVNLDANDNAGNSLPSYFFSFYIDIAQPTVTVLVPVSLGIYQGGTTLNITWTVIDVSPCTVTIEYSDNNGSTWQEINAGTYSSIDDGIESWVVPTIDSIDFLIRINATDTIGFTNSDVTDNNFIIWITYPSITFNAPTSTTVINATELYRIEWIGSGGAGSRTLTVEFSSNDGVNWQQLGSSFLDNGGLDWNTPLIDSGQCLIRINVTDEAFHTNSYISNQFTLDTFPPSCSFDSIMAGVTITSGDTFIIRWTANDTASSITVRIEYTLDEIHWYDINAGDYSNANDGAESWAVPTVTTDSDLCLLRITVTDGAGHTTQILSDTFTLKAKPPYDDNLLLYIILAIVAVAAIAVSALVIRSRRKPKTAIPAERMKSTKAFQQLLTPRMSLKEKINVLASQDLPLETITDPDIVEFLETPLNIIPLELLQNLQKLDIPEEDLELILKELASLSPDEQKNFVDSLSKEFI